MESVKKKKSQRRKVKKTYGIGVLGTCPAINPKEPAEEKHSLEWWIVGKKEFYNKRISEQGKKKLPLDGSNETPPGTKEGTEFWGNHGWFTPST